MAWLISFAGFVLLIGQASGQSTVNCQEPNSLLQAQTSCFAREGITLNFSTNQSDIQTTITRDFTVACSNQEAYKRGLECSIDVSKQCLMEAGVSTDLLPDADRVADGIAYACHYIHEVDLGCWESMTPSIVECSTSQAQQELMGMTDVTDITCRTLKITYMCTESFLGQCRGETQDVALVLLNNMRPPVCGAYVQTAGSGRPIQGLKYLLIPILLVIVVL